MKTKTSTKSEASAAKETIKRMLVGVKGVSGIGITWDADGNLAVQVNVEKYAVAQVQALLARHHLGVSVIIDEISAITFE